MSWLGITSSKYHDWVRRFGHVNQHNAPIPREHWITDDEKDKILVFTRQHPGEGYRRLAFMMLDADVVACSPSTVYRVLKNAGMLAGIIPHAYQERHRLRSAPLTPRTLARGLQLPQH